MSDLMTKSTIYERNEARRTRTLAKISDPRPAPVRVLSGLPGFSIIFPPYQPTVNRPVTPRSSVFEATTTFKLHPTTETTDTTSSVSSPSGAVSLAAIISAAATGGVLSETFFGRRPSPGSPFSVSPSTTKHGIPVFQEGGGAAVLAMIRSRVRAPAPSGVIPISQVAGRAISVSFLFGTKAAVERTLNAETPLVSILASGTAGVAHTVSRALVGEKVVFGREVAATTAYFSAYEAVKYLVDGNETPSKLTVATAGSIAGAVSVLVRGTAKNIRGSFSPLAGGSQRLGLAAFRAAPAHAVLFLGYETALQMLASHP
jgi:hypothetical protein